MSKRLFVGFLVLAVAGYLIASINVQAQALGNPGWLLVGGGILHVGALLVVLYIHTKNLRYHYPFIMFLADLAFWASGFSIYKTVSWTIANQLTGELLGSMGSVVLIVTALTLFYLSEPHETVLRGGQEKGIKNRRGPMTARKFWTKTALWTMVDVAGVMWLQFFHASLASVAFGITVIGVSVYVIVNFFFHNYPD